MMSEKKTNMQSGGAATGEVEKRVVKAMRKIFDPEIPVNIYDLGLVYGVEIDDGGAAQVRMTLTSPACPMADMLVQQVQSRVAEVDGVSSAKIDLVWEPAWTPEMMTEAARLELNLEPGEKFRPPAKTEFFNLGAPRRE